VLEEVGEAGAAGTLVERADVVPEVDGDEREAVIFVGDDLEAVGEGVGLVLDLGELEGFGLGLRGEGSEAEERGGDGADDKVGKGLHELSGFCA
jgi:hypothetical protein